MARRKQELKEMAKRDAKEREKTARKTRSEVGALLVNPDGLDRLRNIADEEWDQAVVESQGEENA